MSQINKALFLLNRLRELFRKKWRSLSLSGKLYFSGNLFLPWTAIGFFSLGQDQNITIFAIFALPTLGLTVAGFIAWVIATLRQRPLSSSVKFFTLGLHALLIPCCISLSRNIISNATGLPAQSFDLTTAILTTLLIPFAWTIAIFSISTIAFSLGMIIWAFGQSFKPFLIPAFQYLAKSHRTLNKILALGHAIGQHLMGLLLTSFLFALLASSYLVLITKSEIVQLAVYTFDFGQASKYPGIEQGRQMKLLDNGLVAYAKRRGLEVDFEITPLKLPPL